MFDRLDNLNTYGITMLVLTIPKGTLISSTHPTRSKIISTRAQIIHVNESEIKKHSTQIKWSGRGSYWRWVEIRDILKANAILESMDWDRQGLD